MSTDIYAFDFDGTLYRGDSFIHFAIFTHGRMRWAGAILKNFYWLFKWKLGLLSGSIAKEKLFATLYGGMPYDEFLDSCRDFAIRIQQGEKHEVVEVMKGVLNAGEEVFIVSASAAEWILPWASEYGVTNVIGTRLEVEDGCLTGRFATPDCHGEEKVRRLRPYLPAEGQYRLTAYGDSKGDRELLAFSHKGLWV